MTPEARSTVFTTVQILLWTIGLPAVVVIGEVESLDPPWRPWLGLVLTGVAATAGIALVWSGGRSLARADVGLFGVKPGPALVDTGLYGYLRHPMDAGIVLLAAAPALALDLRQTWIVPVAALVYLIVGYEPLEERRLLEHFDEEYEEYRSRVPRWLPREPRSGDPV